MRTLQQRRDSSINTRVSFHSPSLNPKITAPMCDFRGREQSLGITTNKSSPNFVRQSSVPSQLAYPSSHSRITTPFSPRSTPIHPISSRIPSQPRTIKMRDCPVPTRYVFVPCNLNLYWK